jgi:hypothetical protein
VRLQEVEAPLDVAAPLRRPAMDQFGEPGFGGRAELPEALALVVQPGAAAADGVEHGRPVLGQQAQRFEAPRMVYDLAGLRDDLDAVRVAMQRRRLPQRRRRHRVLVALMADATARRDDDRDLQGVGRRGQRQRPQARALLRHAAERNLAGRPIGSLRVPAGEPLRELGLEIGPVVKAPAAKEALLDPADEILHGALRQGRQLRGIGTKRQELFGSFIHSIRSAARKSMWSRGTRLGARIGCVFTMSTDDCARFPSRGRASASLIRH